MLIKELLFRISPRLLASVEFYHIFKRRLNWKHPRDINEKINWLKFNTDTSLWTRLADKYEARKYVEECGFGDYLVKLYGKWDSIDDINWDALPNKFVMKVNNGSGDILICNDKNKLNKEEVLSSFNILLHKKFSNYNGEPHYAAMKPCIIAEELLDVRKQAIDTDTMIDYKIWCFNGEPHYVFICSNRKPNSLEIVTYDLEWIRHDEKNVFMGHYKRAQNEFPRPKSFDLMLKMASILSKGIPQVRVDLYEVDGKPYFGEMTFTSAGGFMNYFSQDCLYELGGYVNLNMAPKKQRGNIVRALL